MTEEQNITWVVAINLAREAGIARPEQAFRQSPRAKEQYLREATKLIVQAQDQRELAAEFEFLAKLSQKIFRPIQKDSLCKPKR